MGKYKSKLYPIVYQALTSYPFIEKDFDALTDYELISKLIGKINEIIPLVNDIDDSVADKVEELLNTWLEDGTLEDIINDALVRGGVSVVSRHAREVGETAYILLKIAKDKYELEFHNCSGDDTDSPTTLMSNPLAWLSDHLTEYDIASNCNFGGLDYPGRLAGRDYDGSVFTRRLFCYNSDNGAIMISNSGESVYNISETYDVVFAIGDILISNGILTSIGDTSDANTRFAPRTVFGWDDDYYYLFVSEGRGTEERGLRLSEVQTILVSQGIKNAVNWDGGGSCCLAVNIGDTAVKVNRFRDLGIPYPQLRKVGLCAAFKLK